MRDVWAIVGIFGFGWTVVFAIQNFSRVMELGDAIVHRRSNVGAIGASMVTGLYGLVLIVVAAVAFVIVRAVYIRRKYNEEASAQALIDRAIRRPKDQPRTQFSVD